MRITLPDVSWQGDITYLSPAHCRIKDKPATDSLYERSSAPLSRLRAGRHTGLRVPIMLPSAQVVGVCDVILVMVPLMGSSNNTAFRLRFEACASNPQDIRLYG